MLQAVYDLDRFGWDGTAAGADREVTFRVRLPVSRGRRRSSIVDEPAIGALARDLGCANIGARSAARTRR